MVSGAPYCVEIGTFQKCHAPTSTIDPDAATLGFLDAASQNLNGIADNSYKHVSSDGKKWIVSGWSHTRSEAFGYICNGEFGCDSKMKLVAEFLYPGGTYYFRYTGGESSGTSATGMWRMYANGDFVRSGTGQTCASITRCPPLATGNAVADAAGKIEFTWTRDGTGHVDLSRFELKLLETPAPTEYPTPDPTAEPTPAPTAEPTAEPTTAEPTAEPTPNPPGETPAPTDAPTAEPTAEPTARPTPAPTPAPTARPTAAPTAAPTYAPTPAPTALMDFNCKNVCPGDNCKGTWANDVPRGKQYIDRGTGKGTCCSAWSRKTCQRCCEKRVLVTFVGSFVDKVDRAMRTRKGSGNLEYCAAQCANEKYFALQHGGECYCENDYAHATKYGRAPSECGPTGGSYCNYMYKQEQAQALLSVNASFVHGAESEAVTIKRAVHVNALSN